MLTIERDDETFNIPDRLPVLPLRDVVVFPYTVMPLLVGRQGSLAAVGAATAEERFILLVAQRNAETEEPSAADLYRVGVVARILQLSHVPNGGVKVLVEGIARVKVTRYVPASDHLRAQVAMGGGAGVAATEGATEDDALEPMARRVIRLFEEYVSLHRRIPAEVVALVQGTDTAARQAYGIAAHLGTKLEVRQQLLETGALPDLFRQLSEVLSGEIELLRLERKIDDEVRGSLFQNQREFYLQEQLKAIHKELGQEEGDDLSELDRQIETKGLPDAIRTRTQRELRKLRRMTPLSPEATVSRNFIEWVLALPWTERSEEVRDLEHARRVLEEDHYGLQEVKDRILDFIAVLSLVGRVDGPILCLVGPPGVGKTSLGRSIARALGRKFVRMSLGGVRDEAEIRGHRRTYIGALPGRVIQAMRRAEVINPVILLDEVDKLGQDYRGDPASALLEVLDPEQNRAFNDHYLEVDYDLSQVLFVTTANYLPQIPEPLRDRMEIIRLSGYLDQEKVAIAKQFLIPKQLKQNGLDPADVHWDDDVIPTVIDRYTREAGVRELERRLARIARKVARRRVESAAKETRAQDLAAAEAPAAAQASEATHEPSSGGAAGNVINVRSQDLRDLLGLPPHDPDELALEDKVGVATGLAYTSFGGDVLEIEVSVVGGRGKLSLTGTLGDVMKESASAALSYARSRAGALGIDREFHRNRDLHVHIPAGATPKDGPSAGIAIATAIVSALTSIPVRGDVAMTGEITLRGRVLPIGGLKEKAVAAHRNGIRHVIIPFANAREVEELPEEVQKSVHFHGVKSMDDVLAVALRAEARPERPEARQRETGEMGGEGAHGAVLH